MGGRDLELRNLGAVTVDHVKLRSLAVHCADRIGAEHPTEFDDTDPKLAGRLVAHDPAARKDVLELLDVIGYTRKEKS
ncbi:hypothetical protein OIE52_38880 [Streptomyces canus]|uniref:hypothetical protein n=1 Tax=Streptomyces canus TaxID=58343 RepID=UPI0032504A80